MQLSLISFPGFCTDVPFLEQLDSQAVHVIPGCDESEDSCSNNVSRVRQLTDLQHKLCYV